QPPSSLEDLPAGRALPGPKVPGLGRRVSPRAQETCEAISLRRHCPGQVLGSPSGRYPSGLSAFPPDLSPELSPGRVLGGLAPPLASQASSGSVRRSGLTTDERPVIMNHWSPGGATPPTALSRCPRSGWASSGSRTSRGASGTPGGSGLHTELVD